MLPGFSNFLLIPFILRILNLERKLISLFYSELFA
jgi:hypothetical protein